MFDHTPPPPFNPDYDPMYARRLKLVADSMEEDGFYDNHSLDECAKEVARRLNEKMSQEDN